jgi:glycosyltransferase involved in cell wall biosynthesis
MRVLMIGPSPTISGGISNVVRNYLTEGLDIRVDLIYVTTTPIWSPGRHLVKKYGYFNRAQQQIHIWLCDKSIDLVHQHVSTGPGFFRDWALARVISQYTTPHIIHWHASSIINYGSNPLFKLGARQLARKSNYTIALSENMLRQLKQVIAPITFSAGVIPNGVCVDEFHTSRKIDRYTRNTKLVLFMGRLGIRKGIYVLLDAIPNILRVHPDATFALCGDGDINKVRSRIRSNNLKSQVSVPGYISPEERSNWYAKADVFTLPSFAEGVPGSVLEAMASQLPIVVTPVGGIPEVADENNACFIKPGSSKELADSICGLLSNREHAIKMGLIGYNYILNTYSMDKILERIIACYHRVMGRLDA